MDFFLPVAQVQIRYFNNFDFKFNCRFHIRLIWYWRRFFDDPCSNILGIPPAFAVANEANNILGTSVSGELNSLV